MTYDLGAGIGPETFFEGNDLLELYQRNPDPFFPATEVRVGDQVLHAFHGRIPLGSWLGTWLPLPSIPVLFMGSPVTDLFPAIISSNTATLDMVEAVERAGERFGSWAVIVKDLPVGHPLERPLAQRHFVPIAHDPIWYREVPKDLDDVLRHLSRGRRRGLDGRIRNFSRDVHVRQARQEDLPFVQESYDCLRSSAAMRLERLSPAFFSAALGYPACRLLIFEREGTPFAFQMLWQKNPVWFDKYIGTDGRTSREYSFYSMSMLHLLREASAQGIRWYVAGQGSGKDKAWLGFEMIKVNLWIKPLALRWIAPYLLARFSRLHETKIYSEAGK